MWPALKIRASEGYVERANGTAMTEAKGNAASHVMVGAEGVVVISSVPDRLVRRVQQQLGSSGGGGRGQLAPDAVEQLQTRLQRLHALGEEFTPVRLSPYVAG